MCHCKCSLLLFFYCIFFTSYWSAFVIAIGPLNKALVLKRDIRNHPIMSRHVRIFDVRVVMVRHSTVSPSPLSSSSPPTFQSNRFGANGKKALQISDDRSANEIYTELCTIGSASRIDSKRR